MLTFATDRFLTIILCGFIIIFWWGISLFLKQRKWRRWYWTAFFCVLAGIIGTIIFSWWRLERGLTRTYYFSQYFSEELLKNSPQIDRSINFDTTDFHDWEEFSGNPFSVKWEGYIYLPSETHIPRLQSSCFTTVDIDGILIQTPSSSLDVGTSEGRKGLGQGWSYDETSSKSGQTFAWSSNDTSDIYLGINKIAEMQLTFRAVAFDYPQSPIQTIEILVNGIKVDTVAMKKEWEWQTHTILVSKSIIEQTQNGIAWIQFRYSNAERPSKVIPKNKELRKLAIALDTISLMPAHRTSVITPSSLLPAGFHHLTLLAQSNGIEPFIRLGWTAGTDDAFFSIREDYLFPKQAGTLNNIEQRFRLERMLHHLLFFYKLFAILFAGGMIIAGLVPYANVSGFSQLRDYLRYHLREKWRAIVSRGCRSVSMSKPVAFWRKYDIWIIAALRPFLFWAYFRSEKFFAYAWDDQYGYFDVAMGLINLDPIIERFTFGFPVLLIPFIKIFVPQDFSEIVLPFSIFNAFVLGSLGIYLVFQITVLLVKDRYAARIATLIYAVHPFFPIFAKTKWNRIYLDHVYWGDIVGWNMTSDHVSVVFLLLAIFWFLKYLTSWKGMLLAGAALGYAGLIRMPSLAILIPLLYVALLQRVSWKQYLALFVSMGVVLSPQLLYNWHFFGSPFTFGYTALKHIKAFWTPSLVSKQFMTIFIDHAAFFVIFVTTFLIHAHRKIGGFLILWVALFTIYYAGYEALYNDPIRFLLQIRPALCIAVGVLMASGQDVIERCFLLTNILLLLFISSYRTALSLPSDMIPTTFAILGMFFAAIGILLHVRRTILASLCLYIICVLYLLKLPILGWGALAAVMFLLNLMQMKCWGQFAAHKINLLP